MRKTVFAANWKMYKDATDTKNFFAELEGLLDLRTLGMDKEVVVFPPSILIPAAVEASQGMAIGIGVQNIHWEEQGAFTGEISAVMAKKAGASYCLCGHSERRQLFDESDEMTTHKAEAAIEAELIPIICIGETLYQRENEETFEVLETQLAASLAGLRETKDIMIAYEPVWAIGTGETASPSDAQSAIAFIRRSVRELWGDYADDIPILYGGSVKPQNIKEIMQCADIDGVLVGGASLKVDSFADIIKHGINI